MLTPPPRPKPPKSKGRQAPVGQPFLAFLSSPLGALHYSSTSPRYSAPVTVCALSLFPPRLPTLNFRLLTSHSLPPVYNELPSWLLNPECLMARAPAN